MSSALALSSLTFMYVLFNSVKLLPFFFARIILQPKVDAEFDFPLLKKGLNGNLDLPVSAGAA